MLCVFTGDVAPDGGSKSSQKTLLSKAKKAEEPKLEASALKAMAKWKRNVTSVKQQEADELHHELAALQATLESDDQNERVRKYVEVQFGHGVTGLVYAKAQHSSYASTHEDQPEPVSCFFTGKLTQGNINEIHIDHHLHNEDDVHKILHMYTNATTLHSNFGKADFCENHLLEEGIKGLKGSFAFVLYDKHYHRLVVARDPGGVQPLYWTSNTSGQSLFFSTDNLALFEHAEHITEFPAGGVYISKTGETAGTFNGKMVRDPRILLRGARRETTKKSTQRSHTAFAKASSPKSSPSKATSSPSDRPSHRTVNHSSSHQTTKQEESAPPVPKKSPFDRNGLSRARNLLSREE